MEKLSGHPPHWGWKLYFGLLAVLTAFGLADMRLDPVSLATMAVTLGGQLGLAGFIWHLRTPYDPAMWRVLAWANLGMILLTVAVMLIRQSPEAADHPLWAKIVAAVFSMALLGPLSVALFRYAENLKTHEDRQT